MPGSKKKVEHRMDYVLVFNAQRSATSRAQFIETAPYWRDSLRRMCERSSWFLMFQMCCVAFGNTCRALRVS
eukprot:4039612-Pyramimonas_sp.AAC.1